MGGFIPVVADFLTTIFSNKIIAYFIVLGFFALDGFMGVTLGFNGLVGSGISVVLQVLLNNPNVSVSSFQLLVLVAILPVVKYVWEHSGD